VSVRIPTILATLAFATAGALAQQPGPPVAPAATTPPPPAPRGGLVIGTVYDSVRLRPLAGAVIRVDTSALTGTADSLGRFRITGIPVGPHAFFVEAAVLDTLGITLHSAPENFGEAAAKALVLATPSQETLVEILCSAAWRARGPASFMGRVRVADDGTPAVGGKVSLVWYELDLNGKLARLPRVREGTVAPDGTFRICGLPANIDGRAQVIRGTMTSGDIPIKFGGDVLALRSMSIASPALAGASGDSSRGRGSARLAGRVVSKAGRPVANARVQLDGTTRVTLTRPTGEFVMDSLPPGTQTVSVRLLGYQPGEVTVDLASNTPTNIAIQLEDFVPILETVRVTAQRERSLDDIGFARRKRSSMGWYLDPEDVSRQNPLRFSDLLRTAPGIQVANYNGNTVIQNTRDPVNGCVNIWVDGTPWQSMTPGDIDDYLRPTEIGAVEVYSSTAVPAEFSTAGSSCAAIVAWTKQRLDRRRSH
jgi:hypothetical protein